MNVVNKRVQYLAMSFGLVVAGLLAPCGTDAGHRRTYRRACPAQIKSKFVDCVECILDFRGGSPLKHDVTALAVERNQTGAVFSPCVAKFAQNVGAVMHARWRLHAQSMELGRFGKHAGDFGETRNDPAAITEHADRSALPIAFSGFVRMLQLTHQINHVVLFFGKALQAGDEAGPRAALELVEHWGVIHFLCHGAFSFENYLPCDNHDPVAWAIL